MPALLLLKAVIAVITLESEFTYLYNGCGLNNSLVSLI